MGKWNPRNDLAPLRPRLNTAPTQQERFCSAVGAGAVSQPMVLNCCCGALVLNFSLATPFSATTWNITKASDQSAASSLGLGFGAGKSLWGKGGALAKGRGQGPLCKNILLLPALAGALPVRKHVCWWKWILRSLNDCPLAPSHWLDLQSSLLERDTAQGAALTCQVDWQGGRYGTWPLMIPLVNPSAPRTFGTQLLPTLTGPKCVLFRTTSSPVRFLLSLQIVSILITMSLILTCIKNFHSCGQFLTIFNLKKKMQNYTYTKTQFCKLNFAKKQTKKQCIEKTKKEMY